METFATTGQRHKTESMCEHFILNYRGVVIHKDVFDSNGRYFGNEDATKCIGNGCIETDEREGGIEWLVFMEVDSEILSVFRKKEEHMSFLSRVKFR